MHIILKKVVKKCTEGKNEKQNWSGTINLPVGRASPSILHETSRRYPPKSRKDSSRYSI